MANIKQLKFYLLLLSGIAISIIAIYVFVSSSITGSLFNLSKVSFVPDFYKNILDQSVRTETLNVNKVGATYQLNVYVADTETLRQKGLMNVDRLSDSQGMLFIFKDQPQIRTFWMKDTKIPLDMIFADANKRILYIQKDAQPCTNDPCMIYSSQYPVEYVLEVNGNWSQSRGIKAGDSLSF